MSSRLPPLFDEDEKETVSYTAAIQLRQAMTNSKYLYALLILSLALVLFTGLRRIAPSNQDLEDGTASASAASLSAEPVTAPNDSPVLPSHNVPGTLQRTPQTSGAFVQVVARDADTLNPLLTTNSTSRAVFQKIYPILVDQDPVSGLPTVGRGLATSWQFAGDGRAITFTLRSDIHWSDGVPVTARDVQFTYEAILDPAIENLYRDNFANVNEVQIPPGSSQTLVLRVTNPDCAILQALNQPILPSHLYQSLTAAQLADPNLRPSVSAGPFRLLEWAAGERITLVRNERYWEGAPRLERWELQIIPDPMAQLQALIAGAADWLELAPSQISQVQTHPDLTIYSAVTDSLTFVALNLADSRNPQAGRTLDGALTVQEPHPILGDLRVRQALVKAIDYMSLLNETYGKSGQRLGGYVLPTLPWAYAADLTPAAYDPDAAQRLLDDAGWLDSDGDGVRDRSGMPLSLSLLTNADSEQRVQLGSLLVAKWRQVGINVRFEQMAFDAVADRLLAQQYDMVLIGWDNLGADPANSDFWHSRYDLPGSGANFVSYQNAQVDGWLDEARAALACDPAQRGKLYRQVQRQIYQDLPYVFLSGQVKHWAYPSAWQELQPAPWRFDYNVYQWWKQ